MFDLISCNFRVKITRKICGNKFGNHCGPRSVMASQNVRTSSIREQRNCRNSSTTSGWMEPQPCGYSQDWKENGGLNLWNAFAICEMSETYWRTGELSMKDDSEKPFRDRSFHLERCSSTIRFQQKINPNVTNLGRKFYLEYLLDMHRAREDLGSYSHC